MLKISRLILPFLFLLFIHNTLLAQKRTICRQFFDLKRPEKWWVIKHPFIAKKAHKATEQARIATKKMEKNTKLDGNKAEGQVDAFRHSYWMSLLVKEMKYKKAIELGKAHEKGNYLDYKKGNKEEGILPDKANCEMDLWNNEQGVKIGLKYEHLTTDSLQQKIIEAILTGQLKIIKKDSDGNPLDNENKIIPNDSLIGRWDNGKCLVPSNFIPPSKKQGYNQ